MYIDKLIIKTKEINNSDKILVTLKHKKSFKPSIESEWEFKIEKSKIDSLSKKIYNLIENFETRCHKRWR